MTSIWTQILEEAAYAARQAPRMYFAPFLGAAREAIKVLRDVQRENELRSLGNRAGASKRPGNR